MFSNHIQARSFAYDLIRLAQLSAVAASGSSERLPDGFAAVATRQQRADKAELGHVPGPFRRRGYPLKEM